LFLLQKIERAKQQLRDPKRSIIGAGLEGDFRTQVISPACFENLRAPPLL